MAAVLGLQKGNVRIRVDRRDRLRRQVNERVVMRMHDQRGHGDAAHDPRGCNPEVIIFRGKEARVERRDAVVELA